MKRIFCFGCSFTCFSWPTWVDFLHNCLDPDEFKVLNLGHAGLSNQGIAYTIQRAKDVYNFTEKDLIFVIWTSFDRRGFFLRTEGDRREHQTAKTFLSAAGSVTNNEDTKEMLPRLAETLTWQDDLINSSYCITSANSLANIDFNGFIRCWDNVHRLRDNNDVYESLYGAEFLHMMDLKSKLFDPDNMGYRLCNTVDMDDHPLPNQHLEYLRTHMLPIVGEQHFDFDLAQKIILESEDIIAQCWNNNDNDTISEKVNHYSSPAYFNDVWAGRGLRGDTGYLETATSSVLNILT